MSFTITVSRRLLYSRVRCLPSWSAKNNSHTFDEDPILTGEKHKQH